MFRKFKMCMISACLAYCLCSVCGCSAPKPEKTEDIRSEEQVQEELTEPEMETSEPADTVPDATTDEKQDEPRGYLCLNCEGSGYISCLPCGGTGQGQCQQCEGAGGNCSNCGGPGMIQCATCFGTGETICLECSGTGSLSAPQEQQQYDTEVSGDNGEIFPCPECQGEGRTGVCLNCGGDGWDENIRQICVNCLHTGKNRCEGCDGYGWLDSNGNGVGTNNPSFRQPAVTPDTSFERSYSECWTCHGNGICDNCGGTGRYEYYSEWAGNYCRMCDGNGRCPGCDGRGYN